MSVVQAEKRQRVFWITINRPEKRNALNAEVLTGIADAFRTAESDKDVRAIVLTGAGDRAFCAGADLQPGAAFAFDYATPTVQYAGLLRAVNACPLPTVARVNGTCMAGGLGLLCMMDLAIAAEHAQFGLPEVKVGLFPFQVMALLQNMVPPRILREWCLSGEPFDVGTALKWGLVNYACPTAELDGRTEWLLDRLIDKSPSAVRRGKYALRAMHAMSFEEKIAFAESQIALMALTEDAKEGLSSFTEKRKPIWTGK